MDFIAARLYLHTHTHIRSYEHLDNCAHSLWAKKENPIAINWADLWHWISPIDIFYIQLDYTAQYAHAQTHKFDRTA